MLLTVQILTILAILCWPMFWILSVMMFGGPGATNDAQSVYSTMAILLYPSGIFLVYALGNWPLFVIPGKYLALIGIPLNLALVYASYGSLLSNTLKGIANEGYSVVDQQVYYNGNPLPMASAGSFTLLEHSPTYRDAVYAKDENQVYYRGEVILGADSASFHPLFVEQGLDEYWADNQHVYRYSLALDLNPEQVALFHDDSYAVYLTDGKQLFCNGIKVPDADLASFKVIFGALAKDKHHVYYQQHIILPDADVESFNLYPDEQYYGYDKHHVYDVIAERSQPIAGADPASFELLGRGYMRDQHRVYFSQQYEPTIVLTQVDRDSLVVTDYDDATGSDAYDKHGYILNGKHLESDK
ncbi:DKNYY domain-containing protein [Motilimonas eburnea]|uniref:DKNYY domain-containing protein n=1 Tax=Motilimonas eburnea TaxID=1737488 RepID=UPI001E41997D|nr:DKNYY domain-containing protein [Motilimonas eburnea]MCE2573551.1 DKNYY domain-containing protein [Motilimonas eburnea]